MIFWFENNYTKLNTDNCYMLASGTNYQHRWAKLVGVKFLGITIGNKLKFDCHIANICFQANEKLSVLSR